MLKSYFDKRKKEVGCDEAGRGCLAGPVVAAAVVLPKNYKNKDLDDSKKLSEKQRVSLRKQIENDALEYAIGIVSEKKIDDINILNASFLAMHKALDQINSHFDLILVDGNRFNKYKSSEHECIIKGDGKYLSIAAASILAKTNRDDIMEEYHQNYPHYLWTMNKGYPTLKHRAAIKLHGITEHHRRTFQLLKKEN